MNKEFRNAIERVTQRARKLLEEDFASQLEGHFDVHRNGDVAAKGGVHLSARQTFQRERIVAAVEHKRATGMSAAEAVADYLRDAAFTTLNRFIALKILESRELVQECITKGEQSAGYREFCGMAPGLPLLPDSAGYRLYVECLFDELSTEVKVLFDRRDPSSVLWPRRSTFEQLLEIVNVGELSKPWGEDETIGWVYQFFNGQDERRKMREESQAPRNSRELAVRNQFFTPRYVVQFLTDNTLGRIWYEMRGTKTILADKCEYMVRKPGEEFASRTKKDPRDLRVLDPACGSGHFLLYAFDLLLAIYEEAYADPDNPRSEATGKTLADDYPSLDALRKAVPGLVLAHNLHGVDIDPRCAQIAQLALWMRAQKAYRDLGIGRTGRPQIRRSNIVVAEPLVADEQIAKEFTAKLGDAELGHVFTALVEALKLAGDLGLLLRVEQLIARASGRGHAGDLFAPSEDRIRSALARFLSEEGQRASTRRRLFADDAAQGVGLLSLSYTNFDVIVMNPPFGQPTDRSSEYIQSNYSGSHTDIYATFCARACELTESGMVGAITSRSFLVNPRHEQFRSDIILHRLKLLLDLGLGVMDGAAVEAAAFILQPDAPSFFQALDLKGESGNVTSQLALGDWRTIDRRNQQSLPGQMILYNLPTTASAALCESTPFEPTAGTAREGMKSFDDFRFLRFWWEVQPSRRGWERDWVPHAKGGGHAVYFLPSPLCINWADDGAELRAINISLNGSTSQVRQASTYWGRQGATYSRRSVAYSARALPRGYIFATMGPAVLLEGAAKDCDPYFLLGWLNSTFVRALVELQANKQNYLTGIIKRLPWRLPHTSAIHEVSEVVRNACLTLRDYYALNDADPYFSGLPPADSVSGVHSLALVRFDQALQGAKRALQKASEVIDEAYGMAEGRGPLSEELQSAAPDAETEACELATRLQKPNIEDILQLCLSVALGVSLGRWISFTGAPSDEADCFAEPSFATSLMATSIARGTGVLVDDPGHEQDVVAHLCRTLASALREEGEGWLGDRVEAVRRLFRDSGPNGFFTYHLRAYGGGGRSAPIYWQLATPSASYSVWLYIHAFSNDTFFRVQNDYVVTKLAYEERRLESLANELREGATASQRKALAAQEWFIEELRTFLDEVKRVAPLWKPNLDDGVIINFAPLWRLAPQNKSWQKELKATWDALREGLYDWAHLAMHLWPERVVPKCAADRSLAIAHGLEDVFWFEGIDGKWTAHKTPTRSVNELVEERTSPAVKSALKSLLEAPVAGGKSARRKDGGRRRAATATEGGEA